MAAILMYHRVGEQPGYDPWDLVVTPEHFAAHLAVIRAGFEVLSLQDLCACHAAGCVPGRAVALTFDDGYYDNLAVARPLLEQAGVPATVFLATGFLGQPEFWWDRLASTFAEASVRDVTPDMASTAIGLAPPVTLDRVWSLLRDQSPTIRDAQLNALAEALGVPGQVASGVRPLTVPEAARLASPLIAIGAHTVGHAWLPALDEAGMAQEIVGSVRACAAIAGSSVDMLAYPYGAHDERVVRVVARAGLRYALTTTPAPVTSDSNPLALPRFGLPNCSAAELEARLSTVCRPGPT
jgi:peptidoglycan/xylan/chitin deacetylase (PgdA/CDA1 family)